MMSLGILCLLVLGVAAAPADEVAVPAVKLQESDNTPVGVRCTLAVADGIAIKGAVKSVYQCSSDSEDGEILLAADSKDPSLLAVVAKDALTKVKDIARTPKRRFGGGGGFAGSQSSAFGGGGGLGGYGGGGGGGFANSQSSAFGGGGGLGGYGGGGGGGFANSQSSAFGGGFGG